MIVDFRVPVGPRNAREREFERLLRLCSHRSAALRPRLAQKPVLPFRLKNRVS